jgi:hypothetical protein
MEARVQNALEDLKKSLNRIKTLAEWRSLKELENRTIERFNQFYDTTEQELKIEMGYFLLRSQELQPLADRDEQARSEWVKLNTAFRRLDLALDL